MNNSMVTAFSAMQAFQQKLDVIAGNIANINTDGYKRKTSPFEDLLASVVPQPDKYLLQGRKTPLGLPVGWGSRNGGIQLDLTQGSLRQTDNPLDLALEGNALFEVGLGQPDANGFLPRAWTKSGALQLTPMAENPESMLLTTADGYAVMGVDDAPIVVPQGYTITVSPQGEVRASHNDGSGTVEVGAIKVMAIIGPHLLEDIGDNLYGVTGGNVNNALQQADLAQFNSPVQPIAVRQGFLESSNVDLTAEMTDMMLVQRAFQLGSRALASADTMMNLANNLRG